MIAVGKYIRLQGKKRAAGIDEIDAGKVVLFGDFLRAQVLFDGDGVVSAALDGCVVGDDHTLLPLDQPDACHDACRWRVVVIHIPCRQGAQFQKGRIGVTEQLNALARQQFVALAVFGDGLLASPLHHQPDTLI